MQLVEPRVARRKHLRRHVVGGPHAVCKFVSWLEKYRQPKVARLQNRVLGIVGQQEILGFEVPVHLTNLCTSHVVHMRKIVGTPFCKDDNELNNLLADNSM